MAPALCAKKPSLSQTKLQVDGKERKEEVCEGEREAQQRAATTHDAINGFLSTSVWSNQTDRLVAGGRWRRHRPSLRRKEGCACGAPAKGQIESKSEVADGRPNRQGTGTSKVKKGETWLLRQPQAKARVFASSTFEAIMQIIAHRGESARRAARRGGQWNLPGTTATYVGTWVPKVGRYYSLWY